MINLKQVSKIYHSKNGTVTALKKTDIHVKPNEIFGIIGKSGAGKSTLIRCVNLLETPDTGDVVVGNETLNTLSKRALLKARRKIGMIFQHFNLLTSRTVFQNVAFSLELSGLSRQAISLRVSELLHLVGLSDRAHHYPSQLSGGQKQRVAIARALANQPKILLCDEATSALDPESTFAILQLLENIRDQFGVTILLITHQMAVIKQICDRVAVMNHGEIIEENTVSSLFYNPQQVITKQLIASSIRQDLPADVLATLMPKPVAGATPVIRLWFHEESTSQPIITALSREFHIDMNILQANIETIHHHPFGIMIINIKGDEKNIQAAVNRLESLGIKIEVIGYAV